MWLFFCGATTSTAMSGGLAYHIWNRAAGRLRLFKKDQDYLAFKRILVAAHQRFPLRVLEWCLMFNHWPSEDDEVSNFFRWLTHTHAMRAITHRRVLGMGPLYQGRFKSLPVQRDEHLETLLRYVLRNPLRAKLVQRPGQWRWSGQGAHRRGPDELRQVLCDWPIQMPSNLGRWMEVEQSEQEVKAVREHVRRSRPWGSPQ